jgi:hypothetical protein
MGEYKMKKQTTWGLLIAVSAINLIAFQNCSVGGMKSGADITLTSEGGPSDGGGADSGVTGTVMQLRFDQLNKIYDDAGYGIVSSGSAVNNSTDTVHGMSLQLGADGRVYSPHPDLFKFGGSDFTIELRVKMAGGLVVPAGSMAAIMAKGCGPSTTYKKEWCLYLDENASVVFRAYQTEIDSRAVSVGRIDDGQWHHIAVSRVGNILKIFLDGVQQDSVDVSNFAIRAGDNRPMGIGFVTGSDEAFYKSTSGYHFQGRIDDVRVTRGIGRYLTSFNDQPEASDALPDMINVTCKPHKFAFTHKGLVERVALHPSCLLIKAKGWGGGGAGSCQAYELLRSGGGGAYVEGSLNLSSSSYLDVYVGGGGKNYVKSGDTCYRGGGGGGASALVINGTKRLIAGGGGGAGTNSFGGGAGGLEKASDGGGAFSTYAKGGSLTAAGTGGSGSYYGSGSAGSGTAGGCGNGGSAAVGMKSFGFGEACGPSVNGAGSGGGGLWGGGGGGSDHGQNPLVGHGGGGGSSYKANDVNGYSENASGPVIQAAAGSAPGNSSDSERQGTGQGAIDSSSIAGKHGLMILSWN